MKNKKFWLLYPLLSLLLVFSFAVPASAGVDPVQSFYGDLTIAGDDAPVGTEITAKVVGVEYGNVTTETEGQYGRGGDPKLLVQGDLNDGVTVDFYVTSTELGLFEVPTNETALFDDGKITELNLTVEGLEYGDAPDPTYPTLLASDGARHYQTYSTFLGLLSDGDDKDFEPDANVPNLDLFDDGLVTTTITADNPAETVTFEVTDFMAPSYDLRVNILIDLNADGDWSDAGEHVVVNQPITTTIEGVEEQVLDSIPFSTLGATPGSTWLRMTLTRHEIQDPPWDGTMADAGWGDKFECGETEDWAITIEPKGALEAAEGTDTPSDHGWYYDPEADPYNEMLQIALTADAIEDITLNSVTVQASGTGDDATGIASVDLVVDSITNGLVDDAELPPIATGTTYAADDGSLILTIAGGYTVTKGTTEYFIIDYQMTNLPSVGDTFIASVTAVSAVGASSGLPIPVTGLPIVSTTKTTIITEYTLTMAVEGGGTVTPESGDYPEGDMAITATPASGWEFASWSTEDMAEIADASSAETTLTLDKDKTVTATFTEIPYTLTVDSVGSGSVTKVPDQVTYTYGDVVELTAVPAAGWSFSAWGDDLTGSTNPETITMDADKTVTATFTQDQYTLTINTIGSGSVDQVPAPPYYQGDNTVVTLTANPAAGWSFSAWGDDLTGSTNPETITMDVDKTVTATFTQITYDLTMAAAPEIGGTATDVTNASPYEEGASVSIKAEAAALYQFVNWTAPAGTFLDADAAETTFTMPGEAATVTATFVLVGPPVPVSINAPDEAAEDSSFTATVDIGEVVDLNAAQYDVSFDNTVLWLDDITSGQIDGTPIPVAFTEISSGTWRVVQTMVLDTVSGSGSLAVLHFYVIGSTSESSAIDLSNGMLSGFEGEIPATWTGDLVHIIGIDETPPSVVTESPEPDATNVPLDGVVSATFDEAIDEATLVFTLDSIAGTLSYDSSTKKAGFTPDANLAYETTYTASIQASDLAGNPMAEAHTWSFTTVARDTTPPTVVTKTPEAEATGVAVDTVVTAIFSEAMDELTITADSFTLDSVSGAVSYDPNTYTATFTPSADLAYNTVYTATLSTAITDAAGNPLDEAYSWSFTTAMANLGELIDATLPGETLVLPAGTYSGDVIIDEPITITGTEGTIISGGIHVAPLTDSEVTIEYLTITDYTAYGIWIELVYTDDVFNIRNNTILGVEGSLVGIKVEEVEADGILNIEQNTISGNEVGIELLRRVAAGAIEFNNIVDNDVGLELLVVGEHMVGASKNWWGDISGPEEENQNPGGIGDKIEADGLSYYPWLTREFQTVLDDNIGYFGGPMVWLSAGWNIISTPVALDPACDTWGEYVALGDGLAEHATNPAYRFDGQNQAWVALTSDYMLKPCDAIYVRMASDDIAAILCSPDISVPSKELYSGWNLVGLAWLPTSMDAVYGLPANEALVTVEEVAGSLTGYKLVVSPGVNAYEPSWIYIAGGSIESWTDPEAPPPDGWMLISSGYWVFMLNDGTLAGFAFTPISLGR